MRLISRARRTKVMDIHIHTHTYTYTHIHTRTRMVIYNAKKVEKISTS